MNLNGLKNEELMILNQLCKISLNVFLELSSVEEKNGICNPLMKDIVKSLDLSLD